VNPRQAFKLAYLRRCAEYGMTPVEIAQMAETGTIKSAEDTLWSKALRMVAPAAVGGAVAGPAGATVATAGDALLNTSLPYYLGGGAILGGGALGYAAGAAHDSLNDQNQEEIKQRDMINRLDLATQRAKMLNQLAASRRQSASRRAHWRA
jgi:hypothetical protein